MQSSDQVLWQDYQRHETKQPEKTLEFLKRMEAEAGINSPQHAHVHDRLRAAARSAT